MFSSASCSEWAHFVVAEGSAMAGAAAEKRGWQREAQDGGNFEGESRDLPGFWWELSLHVSEPCSEGPQLPGSPRQAAPPPSAFPFPTPCWLSPIVPPRHFAAPTLGLAMALRQTLGGKVDFSPQKSHLEHSCMVVAPRQPLSIVVLLLPGTT